MSLIVTNLQCSAQLSRKQMSLTIKLPLVTMHPPKGTRPYLGGGGGGGGGFEGV